MRIRGVGLMTDIRQPLFVLPVDLGFVTAASAAAGHPATNLNRLDAIGLTWQTVADVAISAEGEFTASQVISFAAIVAANAQDGATTWRLRLGNSSAEVEGAGAAYDSGDIPFVATSPRFAPDDGLYHSHLELPSPVSATWWRIDISGHTGAFEASMLVMGEAVASSRFYNYDFEQSVQDLGTLN